VAAGIDGLIAALSVGAVIVAVVGEGHSGLFHGSRVRVVYALAYPVGSLTLFAGALIILALRQWRLEARWVLLLCGFGALAVGDIIYAFKSAGGRFHFGTWLDAVYSAGPALVGLAAWRDARYQGSSVERSTVVLAVPGLATLAALAVLLADHLDRLPGLAIVLAGGAITLSVGRTLIFLRQERRYDRVRRDSLTDDLTGLANRRALERLLTGRLAGAEAFTLLVVDLDGFKEINDTLGHAAGDELLIGVAERLVEAGGNLQVARLGGDEFAIVVDGDGVSAKAHADVVRHRIEEPISVGGAVVAVGASIGHAVSNGGASPLSTEARAMTPGELLRRADVAMYRAKELRTHVEMWAPTLDVGTRERLETMAALRAALADPQQLVVFYQPQFDGRSMRLIGMEALARWQHPTRGLLGPGEFLPAAERTGLLSMLTERVLQDSLAQIQRFADAGHRVPVSVNVTAPDLLDLTFADHVAAALESSGVPPELLRLEITETVVMTDPQRVIVALSRLRDLGVLVSLDDYGTGLSSLSYLQILPVDELKIDRGFVSRITVDPASAVIVNSTIELAHALNLTVVAEGVEDQATLDALCGANCDSVQGFLLGRPVPADSLLLPAWLERGAFAANPRSPVPVTLALR
jgi:diguanylate cyclase (GGDEF)-like protein